MTVADTIKTSVTWALSSLTQCFPESLAVGQLKALGLPVGESGGILGPVRNVISFVIVTLQL